MRIRTRLSAITLTAGAASLAALSGSTAQTSARAWEDTLTIPTYIEGLPDPNPSFDFFEPRRINYPYTLRTNLTDRREARVWRTLNLENEYLRCVVLPDLGGHLYRCTDRINDAEVFYANPSIKLSRIGYRGAWAALGIEFNFPVSHNWMSTSPVDFGTSTGSDGSASVWVGNIDRVYGSQWRVRLTLRPGRAVLEQHTALYNRSDFRHRFYWWTNAAVEVWDDSRIIYPMAFTASHGFRDIDTWPIDARGTDNSIVGNHKYGPVSRFSHGSREPYMAVYHPRTRAGVVHYSSPSDLPAKKVWSWGSDANGLRWRRALSDNNSAYVEIQRGLFRNQETYGFLEPQSLIHFSEYWIPIRDLADVSRANVDAVVSVTRDGAGGERSPTGLVVQFNVTREFTDALVTLRDGSRIVARERATLTPRSTFRRRFADEVGGTAYTIELRDAAGNLVLTHTEGQYDYLPASEIVTGPQPTYTYPPESERTEGGFVSLGDTQERDGRRLEALRTYRAGLRRFEHSVALRKAAGRLAVTLKQYEAGADDLRSVLARVSNDYEASYYLGHALARSGDTTRARLAWENAQRFGVYRNASRLALAALAARRGDRAGAVGLLQRIAAETGDGIRAAGVRAAGVELGLLRAMGSTDHARLRVEQWRRLDPTSSFVRYEATRLGEDDPGLWSHLAADPERILEIVVDYVRFGLYQDALNLLEQSFPADESVKREPGMPRPDDYPLISYYRGYVRQLLGRDPSADFDRAAGLPTRYVSPNRPETFEVLDAALQHDPRDATAHFLLGALYLSGGMAERAIASWQTARRLDADLPGLHRNLGYAVLYQGGSTEEATALFEEGMSHDPLNADLYFGVDQAMRQAGRPAEDRADALLRFPDRMTMPADLVYLTARTLASANRFDAAEELFAERYFPSEEGGTSVRQVYLEVRLGRARALVEQNKCDEALAVLNALDRPVAGMAFTEDGLDDSIADPEIGDVLEDLRRECAR